MIALVGQNLAVKIDDNLFKQLYDTIRFERINRSKEQKQRTLDMLTILSILTLIPVRNLNDC